MCVFKNWFLYQPIGGKNLKPELAFLNQRFQIPAVVFAVVVTIIIMGNCVGTYGVGDSQMELPESCFVGDTRPVAKIV